MAEKKHIHFIGIGGSGMSAIAWIAYKKGFAVSGSDLKPSKYAQNLVDAGVPIAIGHSPQNITDDIDLVVISTAILDNNPELIEARRKGIEVWRRTEILSEISQGFKTVAISGSHGKTTTSSLAAHALAALGTDPSFIVGGILEGFDSNAHSGSGPYFVVEADESDKSFLAFDSQVAIITNIELDHTDRYSGIEEINEAFCQYLANIVPGGYAVVCNEQPGLVDMAKTATPQVLSYGFGSEVDFRCVPGEEGNFTIISPEGQETPMRLKANPGTHNMLNATAVVAALVSLGFAFNEAAQAVSSFEGVHRRFELTGIADGVTVIDDYGHHPTEVAATIKAAKALGYKHVHTVFQSHHYYRTYELRKEWGECFDEADSALIMELYAPNEVPIPGVTGKTIVDSILDHNPRMKVGWIPRRSDTVPYLLSILEPGDMVLISGAGDVAGLPPKVLEALQQREANR